MVPATPQRQLETLVVLDERGRIISTREPRPSRGPAFLLIRSATELAWAVRADVADEVASRLSDLACREPLDRSWTDRPIHAQHYQTALGDSVNWGPAFEFPDVITPPDGVVRILDEAQLGPHFPDWLDGEIGAGVAPVMAVMRDGHPVSVCCSARHSVLAAEAGLDTASAWRGRGYAPRVTSAWAIAIRASGRTPLFSTEWDNAASLAVARKLDLRPYATNRSIDG